MIYLNKKNEGAFICFIGIDGSGKTTHAHYLSQELAKNGINVFYIRPRYKLIQAFPLWLNTSIKKYINIRPLLIKHVTGTKKLDNLWKNSFLLKRLLSFFLLIYAFTTYLLMIKPYLRKSYLVCDRYFYDWFYDKRQAWSIYIARILPKPDLCIFLDIPISLAFSRMNVEDKKMPQEYYESLREWYITLAKLQGFKIIDSSGDFLRVNNIIIKCVMEYIITLRCKS